MKKPVDKLRLRDRFYNYFPTLIRNARASENAIVRVFILQEALLISEPAP